jgi:hypothetical protein
MFLNDNKDRGYDGDCVGKNVAIECCGEGGDGYEFDFTDVSDLTDPDYISSIFSKFSIANLADNNAKKLEGTNGFFRIYIIFIPLF